MKKLINTLCALPLLLGTSLTWAGQVDINKADAETLAAELNGIGEAKAEAIVTYRDNLGPFLTVDDLVLVKGIGEGTVEKNRALLLVSVDKEEK
jgi:competence protein ComEA